MIREYFESCSQRKKIEDNKEKILEVLIEKTKEGKLRYRKDLDLIKEEVEGTKEEDIDSEFDIPPFLRNRQDF